MRFIGMSASTISVLMCKSPRPRILTTRASSSVSSEILRKNPDNMMAKQLKNYERAKVIFKGIYKDAYSTSKNHKGKL